MGQANSERGMKKTVAKQKRIAPVDKPDSKSKQPLVISTAATVKRMMIEFLIAP